MAYGGEGNFIENDYLILLLDYIKSQRCCSKYNIIY